MPCCVWLAGLAPGLLVVLEMEPYVFLHDPANPLLTARPSTRSRMESTGEAMKIHLHESVVKAAGIDPARLEARDTHVKGELRLGTVSPCCRGFVARSR